MLEDYKKGLCHSQGVVKDLNTFKTPEKNTLTANGIKDASYDKKAMTIII